MYAQATDVSLLRDAFNLKEGGDGTYYVYNHDERYYLVLAACDHLQVNTVKKSSCIMIPVDEWQRVMQGAGSAEVPYESATTGYAEELMPSVDETASFYELPEAAIDTTAAPVEESTTTFDKELAAAVSEGYVDAAVETPMSFEVSETPLAEELTNDFIAEGALPTLNEAPATAEYPAPEEASFWAPDIELSDNNDEAKTAAENPFFSEAEVTPEAVVAPKAELTLEEKQEHSLRLREKSLQAREAALVIREKAVAEQENAIARQESAIESRLQNTIVRKETLENEIIQLEKGLENLAHRKASLEKLEKHIADTRAYIATSLKKIS